MRGIDSEISKIIKDAIKNLLTLEFDYHNAPRVANPHYFGQTTQGNDAISCWQSDGKSNNGGIPEYRTFKLSDIRNLKITEKHFVPEPSSISPNSSFSEIYYSVFEEKSDGNN